ncbi:hypothetical protein SAMN02910447_03170 [Ruminococcus sp. YE71]|uniref:hypothetical protein n=1 Tax=unclassified Ruminococcus TaxID=2608920 RepID=UPI0008832C23|nr:MULTISPECIES: hypothetical protein [unclassified Ruminococcus]SDA30323.1 hypothetical protein SAMN02910446_03241 [Ruminococcus sp. YE78]SFW49425.1 hypothetical protein SAMN02910447_03170 [Ruminococcus sp. YE71]
MRIKGYAINNDVVSEIGKFAILWNCFERTICNNHCKPKVISEKAKSICIDQNKKDDLIRAINDRKYLLNWNVSEYIENGLYPDNAIINQSFDKDCKSINNFINQTDENTNEGCLLFIYRIRNNLMHGLKIPRDLNGQYELFKAVNGVLESIETI